jgi:hypothetical protein
MTSIVAGIPLRLLELTWSTSNVRQPARGVDEPLRWPVSERFNFDSGIHL